MNSPVVHNFFCPTKEQVELFQLIMNGSRWSLTRLLRSIGKTLYDEKDSRQLLSEAVENALIKLECQMIDWEDAVHPLAQDWVEQHYAFSFLHARLAEGIIRYLPIQKDNKGSISLVQSMVLTLGEHLTDGGTLLIDGGGRVTLEEGNFTLRVTHKNVKIPESECSLHHSDSLYTDET